jgi:hypothetical protein
MLRYCYYAHTSITTTTTNTTTNNKNYENNPSLLSTPLAHTATRYGNDPRTVDKLVDGSNRTCDDLHMWLTPFTAGRHHYVFIDLGLSRTLSMLRIWNYNKSRIHSYRGARYMEVCI